MPDFRFKAIDAKGRVTTGVSNAQDKEGLAEILQNQGLFLMETSESSAAHAAAAGGATDALSRLRLYIALRRGKISLKDVAFFTAQLSIMVRSALPILESLELLAAQATNPSLKNLLREITRRVSEGQPLSQAFSGFPKYFDEVFISLLAAGEIGGDLDVMLDRLVVHLDFHMKLKQKVQSALVYPLIVVLTAMAVIAFIVVFVLPTFMEVFAQLNIELPLPTRILLYLSEALRRWWYFLFVAAWAAWLGFKLWRKRPANARRFARFQLDLPIVGELTRNIVLTRTLRTMASLLESGISILKSLELSKAAAGNVLFFDLLDKVEHEVRDGKFLSGSLAQSPYVPAVVIGMISTGERTGTLPEVINRVAGFYESETDSAIKNLFSALEPLFIVGLGVMVGGIAVSVLLPMFDMASGIQ